MWEGMLPPIIGFAQIGGGEEDEGSGSERLVSKMGQEGQSAGILVRIEKGGPRNIMKFFAQLTAIDIWMD